MAEYNGVFLSSCECLEEIPVGFCLEAEVHLCVASVCCNCVHGL